MSERVLFVDDEPDILSSFKRQFRKRFEIETALGGNEGLELIDSKGPFAVVVSDYNMPGINGIQFLKEVKKKSPDSVRVMLTGQAAMDVAIDAVNEGHIFRFLTKPCPEETLLKTLQSGIEFHNLIIAEKELLEKTLSGSVKVLTEILSLVNPVAFGRTVRTKDIVNHIVLKLGIPFAWQFELAALLSMIGCVTIPPEVLLKLDQDDELSELEQEMVDKHPSIAKELLANIPRMSAVARMIEAQGRFFKKRTDSNDYKGEDLIALCGNLLLISMDYDRYILQGNPHKVTISYLANHPEKYYYEAVQALNDYEISAFEEIERSINVSELQPKMILNENITNKTGLLIALKGQEVTFTMIQRLKAFAKSKGIEEPFNVIEKVRPI